MNKPTDSLSDAERAYYETISQVWEVVGQDVCAQLVRSTALAEAARLLEGHTPESARSAFPTQESLHAAMDYERMTKDLLGYVRMVAQ